MVLKSWGLDILVSTTSFKKSNIGWPQQPPTEKVLKFNMIFHNSTRKIFFQNIKNKAEFKNLDDSEVLGSDFLVFRTSAASMTSTASTTSMASMTSTASFHQKFYWSWWLDHSWHPNDQYWPLFLEWIIKNPNFHWYLLPFCRRLLRSADITFFKTGCWNYNIQTSGFQNHLQTNISLYISICQTQITCDVSIWDTL